MSKISVEEMKSYFDRVDKHDMAEHIPSNRTGSDTVSYNTISAILGGRTNPSLKVGAGIAEYAGLSLDDFYRFIRWVEDNPPPTRKRSKRLKGTISDIDGGNGDEEKVSFNPSAGQKAVSKLKGKSGGKKKSGKSGKSGGKKKSGGKD